MNTPWFVYLVECADGSLYTGVTTDVHRRVQEHNGQSKRAAKYTRIRQPVQLRYHEMQSNRHTACQPEWQIKRLPRSEKLTLIAGREC